ncbi:hypothetical protein F4556_007608 [Kitasatospora gansuensis]|uniref:Uncharacterized protein n=1 Tax=Kitasatospora gansuensis TaxID=258050 RepID=A0A7W7SK48_9ACTN|nr:hypothetical protein [Kitasatospora gansuensis]MBB4951954.1 hypothetical protein [Kitasatospora gansuensis]
MTSARRPLGPGVDRQAEPAALRMDPRPFEDRLAAMIAGQVVQMNEEEFGSALRVIRERDRIARGLPAVETPLPLETSVRRQLSRARVEQVEPPVS